MNKQLDILFIITGNPLPAMLDMIAFAQNAGQGVALILLERGELDLLIDRSFVTYEVITIKVPYKSVDLKRITSMPSIYRQLKKLTTSLLKLGGLIITTSYDLLFFSYFISSRGQYRIRHQVRDLHTLQLSHSLKSALFVAVERILLKRVESVIVSSPEFENKYYKKIFKGNIVLLENIPLKSTWDNFSKKQQDDVFCIGFVGILRYKPSLYQLIDAVEAMSTSGINIKVLFAGGGNDDDLKAHISNIDLFSFYGPYEYTKDIKKLFKSVDLIYSVYDSDDINCQLAMPNKFYESIISRIPIITASNTFVGSEVERLGIGCTVRSGDKNALISLLSSIYSPQGWYKNAVSNLEAIDVEEYYRGYNEALNKCIL